MTFCSFPSSAHTLSLQYLSRTRDYCITYRSLPEKTDFFCGYADAAYANADLNRSITGYVFIAGDSAITWSSKRQISTALSSVQAEYVALSEASREACWLRNLYTELGWLKEDMLTVIKGDNDGSIAMAKNPKFHKQTKHIVVRWHWIRELVQEGTVEIDTCRDPDQTADILTKALPRQKHTKHTIEMGLAPA